MALTEIAYHVRLPKTTVFRYLQTLHRVGFVFYDPRNDHYRTRVRIWALAQSKGGQSVLREAAVARWASGHNIDTRAPRRLSID